MQSIINKLIWLFSSILEKTFDIVNYEMFMVNLRCSDMRRIALNLFTDYLKNWKQCVRLRDRFSFYKENSIGVPQGSILGPILFKNYIDVLSNICNLSIRFYIPISQLFLSKVIHLITFSPFAIMSWKRFITGRYAIGPQ